MMAFTKILSLFFIFQYAFFTYSAALSISILTGSIGTYNIFENTGTDSTITSVSVQLSSPSTNTITWFLQNGATCTNNAKIVSSVVSQYVGELRTNINLDYEATTTFTCNIVARDDGTGNEVTATATVSVKNIFDVAPSPSGTNSFSVNEEVSIGTIITDYTFTDTESSYGDDISCSITAYSPSSGEYLFGIAKVSAANNLKCRLSTTNYIDLEDTANVAASYSLTITGTDKGGNSASQVVTVTVNDINDNGPVCTSSAAYANSIDENDSTALAASYVINTCTDADSSAANRALLYSISDSNFQFISAPSNVINKKTTMSFDYESTTYSNPYLFTVQVVNNAALVGSAVATATVTLTLTIKPINEATPTNNAAGWTNTKTVAENVASGTVLFTPDITDSDKGADGTLLFSLVAPVAPMASNFRIDSSTGQVSVAVGANIDYETVTSVAFQIKAQDQSTTTVKSVIVTATLTITNWDDNYPSITFTTNPPVFSITDGVGAVNTTVGTPLVVTDSDSGAGTLTCSISAGNVPALFRFNPVATYQLELITTPDPDLTTVPPNPLQYILEIQCADSATAAIGGPLTSTATVTVNMQNVNDNTPVITTLLGTYSVDENVGTGYTLISGITVTDADGPQVPVSNRVPESQFDCSMTCTPTPNPFEFVSCNYVRVVAPLDRETQATYTLLFSATDRGTDGFGANSRTGTKSVTINLNDVNDNPPICNPNADTISVNENTATTSFIYTVPCSDADAVAPILSIVPTIGAAPFAVGSGANSNKIQFTTSPNYESVTSYQFKIQATDASDASKSDSMTLTVNILPVNEATPTFTAASISVAESTTVGTKLTTYTATDSDTGGHGITKYVLTSVSPASGTANFQVIAGTGDVYLAGLLDYDVASFSPKTYTLTITATDGGGLSGSGVLTVTVTNVNDNSPICSKAVFSCTMPENSASLATCAAGSIDSSVSATDADPPDTLSYTITGGDDVSGYFSIVSTTGQIKRSSNAGLDYEALDPAGAYYNLTVTVSDGTRTTSCPLKITVTDVQEIGPTFSPTTTTVPLSENIAPGTAIVSPVGSIPTATDTDKWQTLTYSQVTGFTSSLFSVDSRTGVVSVAGVLDYETTTQYIFRIQAVDNGVPINTGTLTVTVNIQDFNEFAPICQPLTTTTNPLESVVNPTQLVPLYCTDGDATASLSYSITNLWGDGVAKASVATPFTFSSNNLFTNAGLDYETVMVWTMEVVVSDNQANAAPKSATVSVTVSVQPVDESAPVIACQQTNAAACPGTPYSVNVDENVAMNTLVATMSATDLDKGSNHATVTWSIQAGNGLGYFKIISNTGEIQVDKSPDRETVSSVTLTVRATDGGGLFSQKDITITINDLNDNKPVFNPAFLSLSISEASAIGSILYDFALSNRVTDADSATSNFNVITLSKQSVAPAAQVNDWTIAGMQLKTANTLDFSTTSSYLVVVRATDGGGLFQDITIIITVTEDNAAAPAFTAFANPVTIQEDKAVGSVIATLGASDVDPSTTLSGTLTYSIFSGNGATNSDFSIDTVTVAGPPITYQANIRVRNALDFDAGTQTYYLGVRVSDSGNPVKTATMTVTVSLTDINDNYPVFTNPTSVYHIAENSAVGTNVFKVTSTDADSGANKVVVYTISSQSRTGPDTTTDLFTINSNTGDITLLQIPDREYESSYVLLVQAASLTLNSLNTFTVIIDDDNDNSPIFTASSQILYVPENQVFPYGPLTTQGSLIATDLDAAANGAVTYVLQSQDGLSNPTDFTVDASAQIRTAISLDRENWATYNLWLVAKDGGTPSRSTSLSVRINVSDKNDNAPVLSVSSPNLISEDALGGVIAATVTGTDADAGPLFNQLTYSITAGQPAGLFVINNLGEIALYKGNTLDRETTASYSLTVQCVDGGTTGLDQQTTFITVPVTILDVNDNTPSFPTGPNIRSIPENSPAGTPLVGAILLATDPDSGANAALTYYITAVIVPTIGGTNDFIINQNTAQITVNTGASLNRESTPAYVLRLIAQDNGSPIRLTGTTSITIQLTDVNDNSPVFSAAYTTGVIVKENEAIGTNVITISASDSDFSTNAVIQFSMDATNTLANTYFQINSNTGLVTVKAPIDREKYSSVSFYVAAEDQGIPTRLTTSTLVVVSIQDVNDNTPLFNPIFYNGEVDYQDTRAYEILVVSATDADATGNTIMYSWSSGSNFFDLSTLTGSVKSKSDLHATKNTINNLFVLAQDSGTPVQSSTAQVRIDVFDFNETGLCIEFGSAEGTILAKKSALLAGLKNSIGLTRDPTNMPRLWKTETVTGSTVGSLSRAYIYVVDSNATQSLSFINTAKTYITQTVLLNFWQSDSGGTPSITLSNAMPSGISATKVGFCATPVVAAETPWIQTPAGIAVIVLAALLAAALIGLAIAGIYKLCSAAPAVVKPVPKFVVMNTPPQPQIQAEPKKLPGPRMNPNEIFRDKYDKTTDQKNTWRGTPETDRLKNIDKVGRLSPGGVQLTGLGNSSSF